ncbi:MAG: LPS-assembly protein LptD [Ignavibacteriales bacterium]|nr:LPS-assembly protein LptD [Ignavibacteriales bacterium]
MKYLPIILLMLIACALNAQTDTSFVKSKADTISVHADTLAADTSKSGKSDIDAVVTATAKDSLIYDVRNKKMFIYGSGDLKFKTTQLTGGKIFVDYDKNELEAFGVEDTADTAKSKLKDTPVLKEGTDEYEGTWLRYNFRNQSGYISMAKNKEEDSRYEGEKVKKVNKDTYFIDEGMFTTCEDDTPHTYFTADEMKVIQGDKIIARWVFMHIGGVPFPVPLPFGVFPNSTGRRSGIIIPSYGQDASRGQYFYNFGYFWAMNDYMDLTLNGDFYSKGGYGLRSRYRYAVRYDFSGSFEAGYSKIKVGESTDPVSKRQDVDNWRLSLSHSQQIDPTMNLSANLSFQSSNYLRQNSISYDNLLQQSIYSTATFNKRWGDNKSLGINYSRNQYLDNGNIDEVLPNISFNMNTVYPFARNGQAASSDKKWYEYLGYSYSGRFSNNRKKTKGNLQIHGGFQHDLSFSASPKLGYFNVSPSFAYQERWYNKRIEKEFAEVEKVNSETGAVEKHDTVITKEIKEINFVRTFSASVSASTRMYGIFQPNVLGIEAFRHTISPSISYRYTPDFSSDTWGYYGSYIDKNGKAVKYNKSEGQIFGGPVSGEAQSLNFSVYNIFEIKTAKDPSDTTKNKEANKIQLLNLDANFYYNFAADSLKLSDLNLGYRTQVGNLLSFSGSSSYTFYDYAGINKINKYLASAGKGLFRLTNLYFTISANLSGEKSESKKGNAKQSGEDDEYAFQKKNYTSLYDHEQTPDFSIPWNLSLSYTYNVSKPSPDAGTKSSSVNANLSFSLTEYWKFTLRGSYDFQTKQIGAPQITIYRDLHEWEMNLVWNPIGTYRGFRFEIRMKAPEFQDLKVTKSGGLFSGRR